MNHFVKSRRLFGSLLFLSSIFASLPLAPQRAWGNPTPIAEWEEIHKDDLVTVYKKEVEGSDVLAVKGVGTLNASFAKIVGVVLDAPHRSEWMEQVKGVEVLKEISPLERIAYWHLSPPWPIRDRDLVIREKVEIDPVTKTITLHMNSIEDPAYPPHSDRVRAELFDATFIATPIEGGLKTAMIAESHADPKGSIPKWVVNIYQKDMPTKSIKRLLEKVADPAVTESPLALRILAQ